MPSDLERLVDLQTAVIDLDEARETSRAIPDWMRELHDERSLADRRLESLEAQRLEVDDRLTQVDRDLLERKDELERLQSRVALASSREHYAAYVRQKDHLESELNQLEALRAQTLVDLNRAHSVITEHRQHHEELGARYQVEIADWDLQKNLTSLKIQHLEERVESFRQDLSSHLLYQFDRLAARHGGLALAPIRRVESLRMWHCALCNYRVRPQVVVGLRRMHSLEPCEGCRRILYLDPVEPVSRNHSETGDS